jgi:large subunit ribosomal protein L10
MNRQQKEELVDLIRKSFDESAALFLIDYKGLSVAQMQALRKGLRKEEAQLKVGKARLIKLAAQDSKAGQVLIPILKEQVALVFATKEPPSIAKILHDFSKEHDSMNIIGGSLEDQLISQEVVRRLASLPSKTELLAQVCRGVNAPLLGLVYVLNMMLLRVLFTLKAIEAKK